jgi:cyclophilin family peptidyl-prolyl cis-trans isomerase
MQAMPQPPEQVIDTSTIYTVTIATDKGDIVADLDPRIAPKTVNNFVALARQGYYDGLTFHRVEPGFVIQGGCPEGTGRGGPGYKFADEPVQGDYRAGALAMANAGPDTNGSQFFVCLEDLTGRLPKQYNLFGHVTSGMDAVLAVRKGDVMRSVTITESPAA